MTKHSYELELENNIIQEDFEKIKKVVFQKIKINFIEFKPIKTSKFINETQDIPHVFKGIDFSFLSSEEDYESIVEKVQEEVKSLGYRIRSLEERMN